MINKQLIINTNVTETRIALIEGGRVAEIFIERHGRKGMVGNIYKGSVARVLPGMQSAFINIGAERSAFLYGGDVVDPTYIEAERARRKTQDKDLDPREMMNRTPIEQLLKDGQEILVQVAKEPLGSKGPRVTTLVTIPGRYLVLLPDFDHVGISRRIENETKREELRQKVEAIRPAGFGLIVRTAAEFVPLEVLQNDLKFAINIWHGLQSKKDKAPPPSLLYQEPDLILKTTRDLYSEDVAELVVDDVDAHALLQHFLSDTIPGAEAKLKLYDGREPIFDHYGVELDLARALAKKVWLPSGGYLVIDQTEAMTTFDVNTGKYVGTQNARDTILKTNLEAVQEVVNQIRLRNMGGILIIDFIDMEKLEDRERINLALDEALKKDKSRTSVLAMNELGLVQMTRKRTSESLERVLTESCSFCSGHGRVFSVETETYNMMRDIERHVIRTGRKHVTVRVRNDILSYLNHQAHQLKKDVFDAHGIQVEFEMSELNMEFLKESPYEVLS